MALTEGLVLDALDLNGGGLTLESLSAPPPAARQEWATNPDIDGALLVRDPVYDNREVTARIRVDLQASMDTAIAKIVALSKKLQESDVTPDGLPLVWTPAQATVPGTMYVLTGEIPDLPIEPTGDLAGWFVKSPVLQIKLTCRPFIYGPQLGTILDDFSTDTVGAGLYTFDAGSGLGTGTHAWTPSDLAGCELSLEVDNITGKVDGDAVSAWGDVSGNGRDATQATGANQPLYKTNIVNGKPVLRFDGVNDSLSVSSLPADATRTIFVVAKKRGSVSFAGLWNLNALDAGTHADGAPGGGWGYRKNQALGDASFGGNTSGFQVLAVRYNSTSSADGFVNSGAATNFDPADSYSTATSLGICLAGSSFNAGDFDVAAVISYNSSLSSTDLDTVRNYLGAKYGLGFGSTPPAVANVADVAVSAGVLTPVVGTLALTAERRAVRSTSPNYTYTQAQVTAKATPGATITSFKAGIVQRRSTAGTYLDVYVDDNGTNSRLRVDAVIAGVRTNRSSTNLAARVVNATAFWVRGRIEGQTVTAEYFTSAPTPSSTPTLSATYTLSGGEQTSLVAGYSGWDWIPQASGATLDDLTIEPFVFKGSLPVLTGLLDGVPGDIPAEARLIVTDTAGKDRRYFEWGLEQRYMDPTTPLILDSDQLVTTGFYGVGNTRTGAYDPNASGNNIIRASLYSSPAAVCGTGNQSHVGTFRVKARIVAASTSMRIRFAWQEGDGPYRANPYATPPIASAFCEIDLGLITIPPKQLGTQRWQGRIEGYSTVAGDTLDVDYIVLVPAGEGYGKARAQYTYQVGSLGGFDTFDSAAAASALNTRTASVGGAWATSGSATDFDAVLLDGNMTFHRSAKLDSVAGRLAVLGAATYTDSDSAIDFRTGSFDSLLTQAALGRYVDINNWCLAGVINGSLVLRIRLAGSVTLLASRSVSLQASAWYRVQLIAFASGTAIARLMTSAGGEIASVSAQHTALATSGALASGKQGWLDENQGGSQPDRYYNNYVGVTPPAEAIALYSGRQAEIRSDGAIRQDSTGTYWGPVPSYRGARCFVPPAGDKNRSSRLLAKGDRNDIEASSDEPLGDGMQMQAVLAPRWLTLPS